MKDKYGWRKEKMSTFLFSEYGIKVQHNTVNKYLHIPKRINPKISLKNIKTFEDKKQRESEETIFKV
ncbi:MAG: hypothetical protein QME57_00140 [Patescibacteria group bacterium]|nr:hypothetical protein [Patescibacteria group bacterium]